MKLQKGLKSHLFYWIIFISVYFLVSSNRIVITSNIIEFDKITIVFCDGSRKEIIVTNEYELAKIQECFKVQFFIPAFEKHNAEYVVKFFKDEKIKGHILYDSNSNTFHTFLTIKALNSNVCRLLDSYIAREFEIK